MSSMESLADLMQDELKDIYDAEKQLTKALPKLAKRASNEDLRDALEQHLQETEGHVERLGDHGVQSARPRYCWAIRS